DRLPKWHKPGLLLIGDAAHVMSPAGGNGINYAIMDAVAAANILSEPLKRGHISEAELAKVQKRRERPTKIIQAGVNVIQATGLNSALAPNKNFALPPVSHVPGFAGLVARVIAYGVSPEHVK